MGGGARRRAARRRSRDPPLPCHRSRCHPRRAHPGRRARRPPPHRRRDSRRARPRYCRRPGAARRAGERARRCRAGAAWGRARRRPDRRGRSGPPGGGGAAYGRPAGRSPPERARAAARRLPPRGWAGPGPGPPPPPPRSPRRAGVEMCVAFDDLCARARYAVEVNGFAPAIGTGPLEIRNGRHPLLVGGEVVVPFDLVLAPDECTVLVSGPNTGGKTVLIKAVGLLALMAQSGIIPPIGPHSTLPVFTGVFADIGDRQSIAASLSTFRSEEHTSELQSPCNL